MSLSGTAKGAQLENQGTGKRTGSTRIAGVTTWIVIAFLLFLWLLGQHFQVGGKGILILPALALLVLLIRLNTSKNIEAEAEVIPNWNPQGPADSLAEIHSYVIREAGKSIQWYWRAKRSKALPSQLIRFSAWIFAAVGGLLPVIGTLFHDSFLKNAKLENGLWASLLLGIAAALVGLDRAFGYSSGWARYVLTATNIRKTLEEFRMEWTELMAKAGTSLTPENVAPLIERARKFRAEVEVLVLQETKDWVTEFQSSMAQIEKDVAAQLTALKGQIEKTGQTREAESQPGSIQLSIQNAAKADAATMINVFLTDAKDQTVQEAVSGTTWARLNLLPGQYKVRIQATVKGQTVEDQKVVVIKPGEIKRCS